MSRLLTLLLFICACPASPAMAQITEQSLIRPVKAGELSAEAVAQVLPGVALTRHNIRAGDGTRLSGVLLRKPGAKTTILYFGGNQFTVGRLGTAAARLLGGLGANLMLVDHRGYGLSEGAPTAGTLMSDGLDVYDYLARTRGIDANRIVVHGQSLGSFIAGHVAANRPAAGVVLESSITTVEDWVQLTSGGRPMTIAPELQGQGNQRNVGRIEEPLLILVGGTDAITPPALSEALFARSPLPQNRKSLLIVPAAGHNDVLAHAAAQQAYRTFLAGLSSRSGAATIRQPRCSRTVTDRCAQR